MPKLYSYILNPGVPPETCCTHHTDKNKDALNLLSQFFSGGSKVHSLVLAQPKPSTPSQFPPHQPSPPALPPTPQPWPLTPHFIALHLCACLRSLASRA